MATEDSTKLPEVPANLNEFIDCIDWHDEKGKQHLKDILAMVHEGALEKWKAKYLWHVAFHSNKKERAQAQNARLPEELRFEKRGTREYPDEYYQKRHFSWRLGEAISP